MMLTDHRDAAGEGGQGRSREPWFLRVAEAAGLPSRGSVECSHGLRVSVLPGAALPALAGSVIPAREIR